MSRRPRGTQSLIVPPTHCDQYNYVVFALHRPQTGEKFRTFRCPDDRSSRSSSEASTDTSQEQTVLEEVFTSDYNVTDEEVKEYADFVGIDVENEPHFLHLAKKALLSPLPYPWRPILDRKSGSVYYFDGRTGRSSWVHPIDPIVREIVISERERTRASGTDSCIEEFRTEEDLSLPCELKTPACGTGDGHSDDQHSANSGGLTSAYIRVQGDSDGGGAGDVALKRSRAEEASGNSSSQRSRALKGGSSERSKGRDASVSNDSYSLINESATDGNCAEKGETEAVASRGGLLGVGVSECVASCAEDSNCYKEEVRLSCRVWVNPADTDGEEEEDEEGEEEKEVEEIVQVIRGDEQLEEGAKEGSEEEEEEEGKEEKEVELEEAEGKEEEEEKEVEVEEESEKEGDEELEEEKEEERQQKGNQIAKADDAETAFDQEAKEKEEEDNSEEEEKDSSRTGAGGRSCSFSGQSGKEEGSYCLLDSGSEGRRRTTDSPPSDMKASRASSSRDDRDSTSSLHRLPKELTPLAPIKSNPLLSMGDPRSPLGPLGGMPQPLPGSKLTPLAPIAAAAKANLAPLPLRTTIMAPKIATPSAGSSRVVRQSQGLLAKQLQDETSLRDRSPQHRKEGSYSPKSILKDPVLAVRSNRLGMPGSDRLVISPSKSLRFNLDPDNIEFHSSEEEDEEMEDDEEEVEYEDEVEKDLEDGDGNLIEDEEEEDDYCFEEEEEEDSEGAQTDSGFHPVSMENTETQMSRIATDGPTTLQEPERHKDPWKKDVASTGSTSRDPFQDYKKFKEQDSVQRQTTKPGRDSETTGKSSNSQTQPLKDKPSVADPAGVTATAPKERLERSVVNTNSFPPGKPPPVLQKQKALHDQVVRQNGVAAEVSMKENQSKPPSLSALQKETNQVPVSKPEERKLELENGASAKKSNPMERMLARLGNKHEAPLSPEREKAPSAAGGVIQKPISDRLVVLTEGNSESGEDGKFQQKEKMRALRVSLEDEFKTYEQKLRLDHEAALETLKKSEVEKLKEAKRKVSERYQKELEEWEAGEKRKQLIRRTERLREVEDWTEKDSKDKPSSRKTSLEEEVAKETAELECQLKEVFEVHRDAPLAGPPLPPDQPRDLESTVSSNATLALRDLERGMQDILWQRKDEIKRQHNSQLDRLREGLEKKLDAYSNEAKVKEVSAKKKMEEQLAAMEEYQRKQVKDLAERHCKEMEKLRLSQERAVEKANEQFKELLLEKRDEFESRLQELRKIEANGDVSSTLESGHDSVTTGKDEETSESVTEEQREKTKKRHSLKEAHNISEVKDLRRLKAEGHLAKSNHDQARHKSFSKTCKEHSCPYEAKYYKMKNKYTNLVNKIQSAKKKKRDVEVQYLSTSNSLDQNVAGSRVNKVMDASSSTTSSVSVPKKITSYELPSNSSDTSDLDKMDLLEGPLRNLRTNYLGLPTKFRKFLSVTSRNAWEDDPLIERGMNSIAEVEKALKLSRVPRVRCLSDSSDEKSVEEFLRAIRRQDTEFEVDQIKTRKFRRLSHPVIDFNVENHASTTESDGTGPPADSYLNQSSNDYGLDKILESFKDRSKKTAGAIPVNEDTIPVPTQSPQRNPLRSTSISSLRLDDRSHFVDGDDNRAALFMGGSAPDLSTEVTDRIDAVNDYLQRRWKRYFGSDMTRPLTGRTGWPVSHSQGLLLHHYIRPEDFPSGSLLVQVPSSVSVGWGPSSSSQLSRKISELRSWLNEAQKSSPLVIEDVT